MQIRNLFRDLYGLEKEGGWGKGFLLVWRWPHFVQRTDYLGDGVKLEPIAGVFWQAPLLDFGGGFFLPDLIKLDVKVAAVCLLDSRCLEVVFRYLVDAEKRRRI